MQGRQDMLVTVDLTDIDLIFSVILTDVNFKNIFLMVTVVLKQMYLCPSQKKLKDLNFYKNTKKISGLYVQILSDFGLLYLSLFK